VQPLTTGAVQKTAVSFVVDPSAMLVGFALKLCTFGAPTAVTCRVAVAVTPAESVTVSVRVGVAGRLEVLMVTLALVATSEVKPAVVTPAPVIWQLVTVAQCVPLMEKFTGTMVELPVAVMVVAGVVKLLISGAAFTVTAFVTTVPAEFVTVSVYVVVALGVGLAVCPPPVV
jgi:hypothetical protein